LVLGAAACIGKLDTGIVSEAMAQVKTKDVEAWARECLGTALLAKRRRALGRWREKERSKKVGQELAGTHLGDAVGF